jgi:hypothetical protein
MGENSKIVNEADTRRERRREKERKEEERGSAAFCRPSHTEWTGVMTA